MEVVLYNYKTGQYLKLSNNNRADMTSVESKAKRFAFAAAKNYRTQNLPHAIWGIDADDFDIVLAGTGKVMQPAPNRSQSGEKQTQPMPAEQECELSLEAAYEQVNLIREKILELDEALSGTDKIRHVLEVEQFRADGAIQDIQHKAEFDALGAADGYKLYKLLREKRIERRYAKDALRILSCLGKDLQSNVTLTNQRMVDIEANNQVRSYLPRELPELFE